MAISLNNETKTKIDLTNEEKNSTLTWDEADMTWDEATGKWSNPKLSLANETKTKIDLSLENKP